MNDRQLYRVVGLAASLFMLLLLGACPKSVILEPQSPPATDPQAECLPRVEACTGRLEASMAEAEDFHRRLAECEEKYEAQRIEGQRMRIALLEKEAQNRQLKARLSLQKQMADEAVIEVVRAKAKLRSIESRAEAASTIAETEIAIKGVKEGAVGEAIGSSEHLIKADSLLKMSTDEFKRENYGGALYLAGQAKIQIKAIRDTLEQDRLLEKISGEVVFVPPLPLMVTKRSNLRSAPSILSDVVRILGVGTLVVGHSHKDEWIRVNIEENGVTGWIHQSLVDAR